MTHIRHRKVQLGAHLFHVQSSKCSYIMCIKHLLESKKKILYTSYTDGILLITITATSGSTLSTYHLLTGLTCLPDFVRGPYPHLFLSLLQLKIFCSWFSRMHSFTHIIYFVVQISYLHFMQRQHSVVNK